MRKHDIDNLRWMILLVLIPYHAAQAWNTWGEPNYIFFEGNPWISSIIVFFNPYFMPLLFVLAGMSTKYALQKRSAKEYLRERTRRLLVPFLFGALVLAPVMSYLGDKFNYSYAGGFLNHYAVFFTKYTDLTGADGGFSVGQFWFLLYLFLISVLGVGIIALTKRVQYKSDKSVPFLLVPALGLPLPILSGLLSIGGKSFAEYTYLFLLGYYVLADESIRDRLEKSRWLLLGTGLAAAILNVYLFLWADAEYVLANAIAKYVAEWFMLLALIGLAKKYLNFTGNVSAYMNRRSFLFFTYHFIWVVFFQYVLYNVVRNDTTVLFAGCVVLSYLATFVCCEISIRIPVLCRLTGTK